MRVSDRKPLYPSIGALYPEATEILSDAGDESALGAALEPYPVYRKIWEVHQSQGVENKSIDDAFYEREVQLCELTFQGQMHFGKHHPPFTPECHGSALTHCVVVWIGCFYGYVKLKEQEIRNIVWICECIVQNQRDAINNFIPIFSDSAPWRSINAKKH